MLNEIIGTLAFDLTLDLSENPDTNVDRQKLAKTLKDLSQLVKTLEEASQVNEKRTAKLIRDAKLEAAEAIEKECVKKGLSSDAVKTFRAGLGFEDGHDIIDI
jgi:type VI protein secretion system component VasF